MTDERDESRRGGLAEALRRFLETLREFEEEGDGHRSGRRSTRWGDIEYDYAVRFGSRLDSADSRPAPGSRPRPGADRADEEGRGDDRGRKRERNHPVSVRTTDGGAVVAVDLPGVDAASLRAGMTRDELAVLEGDEVLVRVSLPREDLEVADSAYNNGVLELTLREENS